jgi:hypothetical protein
MVYVKVDELMELLPWVLIVSLWLDDPPRVIPVHTQVYPNYESCMKARETWNSKFVAICGLKTSK